MTDFLQLAFDQMASKDFAQHLSSFVTSQETLLSVVDAMRGQFNVEHLEHLEPFIAQFKPTVSQLLKLSHIFCDDCNVYVPSMPVDWIENNPEFFETDVFFFYHLFKTFPEIARDVPSYPLTEFYSEDRTPISGQTKREMAKVFYTMINHYEYIMAHLYE